MIILSLVIWGEEYNISIDSNIPCVIYVDMPMTRLTKKKDNASEAGLDSEPASELSSDERGDAEVAEAELLEFIDDYSNY